METITVNEIIEKLKKGELDNPSQLADFLVILSASLNTGGQLALDARIEYAKKWIEIRSICKTDKECDLKVMQTQEYRLAEIAKLQIKVIEECIRSLKKKLMNLNTEFLEGQNY